MYIRIKLIIMQKKFILVALAFIMFSCKGEQKQEEVIDKTKTTETKDNKTLKNTMEVTIKGVFEKDDRFQLLYTESKEESYTLNKVIRKKIIGSKNEQKITYTLPKEIFPSKLRLDFGKNREQGTIMINNVLISLEGQNIEISNKEFLSYFRPNTWISRVGVSNESEYKLVVKDIKISETKTASYSPYFSATTKLISALETL